MASNTWWMRIPFYSKKDLRRYLVLIPSPSPFNRKFKLWAGTVWRQNIVGCWQQTFKYKKFVDNDQQYFALTPFPPIIFPEGEGDGIKSRLPFKIFSILIVISSFLSLCELMLLKWVDVSLKLALISARACDFFYTYWGPNQPRPTTA